MGAYKVIYRDDLNKKDGSGLRWIEGCPLQLTAVQVSRETGTQNSFLQLKVINISDCRINSVEMSVLVKTDVDSINKESQFLDIDLAPGAERPLKPVKISVSAVQDVEVHVDKVVQGTEEWKPNGRMLLQLPLPKKPCHLSDKARKERNRLFLEGGGTSLEAASYELVRHEGWWQCACGAPNVGERCCRVCSLPLKLSAIKASESELEKLADEREERGKAKAAALAKAAAERKKKIKRYSLRGLGVLVVVCCLIVGGLAVSRVMADEAYVDGEAEIIAAAEPNDVVSFGRFNDHELKWSVLAKTDGKALLLATDQASPSYVDKSGMAEGNESGWFSSSISKWLQDEYAKEFTSAEKRRMIAESGGSAKVTLLRTEDVVKYCPVRQSRICHWSWPLLPENDNCAVIESDGMYRPVSDEEWLESWNRLKPAIWIDISNQDVTDSDSCTVSVVGTDSATGRTVAIDGAVGVRGETTVVHAPFANGFSANSEAQKKVTFGEDSVVEFKMGKAAKYTIVYKCGTKTVKSSVSKTGYVGEEVTVTAPNISGYTLKSDKKVTLTLKDGSNKVRFEYKKKPASKATSSVQSASGGTTDSSAYSGSASSSSGGGGKGHHDGQPFDPSDFEVK